jgi:hypothetical protein
MVVNWQDKTVQDRLLTAVIASVDKASSSQDYTKALPLTYDQISAAEIARLYGENMTYHAIENYLRRFRKIAKEMKDEAADRAGPVPSPARPRVTKKASTVSSSKAGAST